MKIWENEPEYEELEHSYMEVARSLAMMLLLIGIIGLVFVGWKLWPNLRDAVTVGALVLCLLIVLGHCFERGTDGR